MTHKAHNYINFSSEQYLEMLEKENKMKRKLKKYRDALKLYANKHNWDDDPFPTLWDNGDLDVGKRARKALGIKDDK